MDSWGDIMELPWMQEHGDTIFDGRTVESAVDPGATADLSCNVLDEMWLPDLDDERPETMTITERIKELYDRLDFLNELDAYQENPDPNMAWKYENREEYEDICRKQYQDALSRLEYDPDNQGLSRLAKMSHQRLVLLRTYDFLASDPEVRRNEIEYEVNALMASRDGRFKEAFLQVNEKSVKEQASNLLNKIPIEQFDRLASLVEEKTEPDQEFADMARDMAAEALGLSDVKIEVQFYTDESRSNSDGNYDSNDDGSFVVYCNKLLDDYDDMTDNFVEYGDTIAHEIRHIKQKLIRDNEPESELGQLYAYCNEFYVKCDLDYSGYASQLVEAEAFSFGGGFGERLYDALGRVEEEKRKKVAALGRKLINASEVNNG